MYRIKSSYPVNRFHLPQLECFNPVSVQSFHYSLVETLLALFRKKGSRGFDFPVHKFCNRSARI